MAVDEVQKEQTPCINLDELLGPSIASQASALSENGGYREQAQRSTDEFGLANTNAGINQPYLLANVNGLSYSMTIPERTVIEMRLHKN